MNRSEKFARFAGTESVRENLKTKSVRGALFTAAGGGMDFVLRLVSTAILARLVIPEHWGLVGMVTALTAIIEQFRDFGLSAATVQGREISHQQVTNLFWLNALGGLLIALLISAASPGIAAFYGDPRLILIAIAAATNFFWGGLTTQHYALLSRQMDLPQIAVVNFTANALSAVVAIVFALHHYGYWALVFRDMTRAMLVTIGVWTLCPWVPGLPKRGVDMGNLLCFGRDLTLTHIVDALASNADKLLIGKFSGAGPLGMYRQAYWLIMAPVSYLCAPINRVAQPALSALQGDPERYRRYYERIVFLVSLITVPLGLFVAVYAQDITLLILGKKWAHAAVFLRVFALASCIWPVLTTSGLVLLSRGRSKTCLFIALMHNLALVVLMLVGVRWGTVGIAAAYVVKSVILSVPTLHFSFRDTPVSIHGFLAAVARPVMAGLLMGIALTVSRAVLPLHGSAVVSLASGGVVGAGVYLGIWIVLPGPRNELIRLVVDLMAALRPRVRSRKEQEPVVDAAT